MSPSVGTHIETRSSLVTPAAAGSNPVRLTQSLAEIRQLPPEQQAEALEQLRVDVGLPESTRDLFLRALADPREVVRLQSALLTGGGDTRPGQRTMERPRTDSGGFSLRSRATASTVQRGQATPTEAVDVQTPTWEEPTLLSDADVHRITGRSGPLDQVERAALEYTNLQVLEGGDDTDLATNIESLRNWHPPLYTEAQARALDGEGSTLLSPCEQQILEYTNQQILAGGPHTDLAANYRSYLASYRQEHAHADAERLYDAIKGVGTDNEAVVATMAGKSRGEMAHLKVAFNQVLQERGEATDPGDYDSNLARWIDGDMGGGWLEKAMDAYNSRPLGENTEYFASARVAEWWGNFIRDSDAGAKSMIENGNLLERGIGHVNQAIFGAAGAVNDSVQTAQTFYIEAAQNSDSGVVRFAAKTGFVLSSIGGSLGTKALDPTLSNDQIEEGMFDLALTLGTFGAGKLVQAGAKTATGMRVLARVSAAMTRVSRLSYGLKRMAGLAKSADDFTKSAERMRNLASSTRNARRAARAERAAAVCDRAAEQAVRAERSLEIARQAETVARQAVAQGTDVERAAQLAEDAARAMETAKREVEALRLAEQAANEALSQAGRMRALGGTRAGQATATESERAARLMEKVESGKPLTRDEAIWLAEVDANAPVRFHGTDAIDEIMDSGRVAATTERFVYASRQHINSIFRQLKSGVPPKDGLVVFQGEAANLFKPHEVRGIYSGMKRAAGQQITSGQSDIVITRALFDAQTKTLTITGARMVTQGEKAFLLQHSEAWASARLWGRRIFLDGGLTTGVAFNALPDEAQEAVFEYTLPRDRLEPDPNR